MRWLVFGRVCASHKSVVVEELSACMHQSQTHVAASIMSCAVVPAALFLKSRSGSSFNLQNHTRNIRSYANLGLPSPALVLPSPALTCQCLGNVCSKTHMRKRTQVMILDESNYEKFSANPKDETVRGCQEERVLNTQTTCFSLQTKKCRTHPDATHANAHVNYTHVVIRCGEHSPGSCLLR